MTKNLKRFCRTNKSVTVDLSDSNSNQYRRERLFKLLKTSLDAGNQFRPVNEIGSYLSERRPAVFLKHDIHGLNLKSLVNFAAQESKLGIFGTYFFMAPNHPDTIKYYDFSAQSGAMKEIQKMGHEIGLHFDPFFLMYHHKQSLHQIMDSCLTAFRELGLDVRSMNMHGKTGHKHLDKNGYGTSFELFEEIARQPDFPALESMHEESAEVVRKNRLRLKDYNISFWADMPIWAAEYGYIVSNYITDNALAMSKQYKFLTCEETANQFVISPYQPPGATNRAKPEMLIKLEGLTKLDKFGSWKLPFNSVELDSLFETKPFVLQPAQILLHPQFYCD